MTFAEALKKEDFQPLFKKLVLYAEFRLGGVGEKKMGGLEPFDIVAEVIIKALDGTRKWDSSKISLREFLYGVVKSDIQNFLRKNKNHQPIVEFKEEFVDTTLETAEEKAIAISKLKYEGATEEELEVFDCLIHGIQKPRDIAENLKTDVEEIYKIERRLRKRINKIRIL